MLVFGARDHWGIGCFLHTGKIIRYMQVSILSRDAQHHPQHREGSQGEEFCVAQNTQPLCPAAQLGTPNVVQISKPLFLITRLRTKVLRLLSVFNLDDLQDLPPIPLLTQPAVSPLPSSSCALQFFLNSVFLHDATRSLKFMWDPHCLCLA